MIQPQKTCRHCCHWQTRAKNKYGQQVAAPMLKHGMATCKKGVDWYYLPQRTPACKRYEPLEAEEIRQREIEIVESNINASK